MSDTVIVRGTAIANDRLLAIPALLSGQRFWPIVDTGATHIALLPRVIADLGLPRLPTSIEQISVGQRAAVAVPAYRLDRLTVEGLTVEDLDVIPLDWPERWGVHGILGMSYLSAFPRFCLDLVGLTLELHLDD